MSIPVSERLTTLHPSASILTILENDRQPIYGFHRLINDNTGDPVEFLNVFAQSQGFNFEVGKGRLPSTSGTWDPSKRFTSDGFIFAHNPFYNNGSQAAHLKFPRLYYKSGTEVSGNSKLTQAQGLPIFTMADILENGYFYVKKQNGEPFSVNIGGQTFTDADFGFSSSADLGNFILPDLNGDGSTSSADLSGFLSVFGAVGEFTQTTDVFGTDIFNNNPYNKASSYYEVLTQFNAYPAITMVGVNEVKSFPGEFSLLLYDAKRDSSHQITVTHLAEVIADIAQIVGSSLLPGGSVNITAPMLTTSQIENFFSTVNTPDLNGDGSVSTADLLEVLVSFGNTIDESDAVPSLDANTAFSYHNGFISVDSNAENIIELGSPYYPASSLPSITSGQTQFQSSYGSMDFLGKQVVPIGDVGTYQASNIFTASLISQSLFDSASAEAAELFWRLHNYIAQVELAPGIGVPFGPHTSPPLFVFAPNNQQVSLLGSQPMPEGNTFCFPGGVFDEITQNEYFNQLDFVFSDMYASGENLYANTGPLFTYSGIVFENVLEGEVGENPPPWAMSNIISRKYIRLGERSTTTSSLLNANARFEVTVQGYVCCNDSQSPLVPIFLRMSGISSSQNIADPLVPSFSDVVYLLGHVDMSSDTQYDEANDEKYKTFTFVRDFNEYVYPTAFGDQDFALTVANTMPSQINASTATHFNLFSFQTVDFAKAVFITAVKFNYKNSRSATLS